MNRKRRLAMAVGAWALLFLAAPSSAITACSFTAKLSDDSASAYASGAWNGNAAMDWAAVPDGFSAVYSVRYRAASPGQRLTVTWTLEGEPNRFLGQARLQAATLAEARFN